MSKWETIFTNRSVSKPVNKKADNIIKNTKSLSIKEMKEHSEALYAKRLAKEDELVKALDDGKLKSDKLIKQAKALKAKQEKKNKPKETAAAS